MIKTFWGWSDQQLPDGTLIWKSPSGQTYITTPGSAVLFRPRCAERAAKMPQRRRTRAQNRANYITSQRLHNQKARQARQAASCGPAPPADDDESPPF